MGKRIIIDCDPGVDDALAILMALASPELEVRGITTVFGNTDVAITTRNARTLLRAGGRPDIAVGRGADGPLIGPFGGPIPHIHGHDGLGDGGVKRASPDDAPADCSALDLLRRETLAAPGELTILAIGPLTNLALFARVYPEVAHQVCGVVLMGGNALSPGNATPGAEANIYNDPEAAEVVFGFDWPVTMIGLDVTEGIVLGPDHLDAIGRRHELLARAVPLYRRFFAEADGIEGIIAHDPAALAFILQPELFDTRDWPVRVELSGIGRGKTWVVNRQNDSPPRGWDGRRRVQVAVGAETSAVADLITRRLAK